MRREQEAPEEDKEEKTEDRWCWTEAFFFYDGSSSVASISLMLGQVAQLCGLMNWCVRPLRQLLKINIQKGT